MNTVKRLGRPTDSPKTNPIHVRLDSETLKTLDEYCKLNNTSRTEAVRKGIMELETLNKPLKEDIKMELSKECKMEIELLQGIFQERLSKIKKQCKRNELWKQIVEINFLDLIISDIEFIKDIPSEIWNERKIYLILRNCLEQVIIFKFLCKRYETDNKVFLDYMGENIPISEIESDLENENIDESDALRMMGGKRTKSYKNKFYELASEFEDVENEKSLYYYYRLLADYCHNSYYHAIKHFLVREMEIDRETINLILYTVLVQFCEEFSDE